MSAERLTAEEIREKYDRKRRLDIFAAAALQGLLCYGVGRDRYAVAAEAWHIARCMLATESTNEPPKV